MFTGLIEEIGRIESITRSGQSMRLNIRCKIVLEDLKVGDSVSVDGICLTVTSFSPSEANGSFLVDVMPETFRRTELRLLHDGSVVNLERAMKADGRFGGHIVTGHIDGTGVIHSVKKEGNAILYAIRAKDEITNGIVEKGSVAIDGISLTVVWVGKMQAYGEKCFCVSVIPHTRKNTSLSAKKSGSVVNIECDILGKYAAKAAKQIR